MEITNKNDFIDIYVLKTLSEIKHKVKQEIELKSDLERQTDEKMKLVLKDLINANFKNLQMDPQGNLIYTLLPINETTIARLNHLIQNTNYSNILVDFDLLTGIFSDDELAK